MRLYFKETPWDLYAAFGYTAVMTTTLLVIGEGNLLAIGLVLFPPGYVLLAALFPGSPGPEKPEIDWIERIALSLGLSIAVVPLLGFLLNFTPWGIRFAPVASTIALFTAAVGCAAYWRRMRLPPQLRLSLTLELALHSWNDYSALDRSLTIVLAATIVAAGATFAYVVFTPRPEEPFTEFYILGPSGSASGYPTNLNVSQTGSTTLAIANHEHSGVIYTVRIDLVGVQLVNNATSGYNETVEVNRTTWVTFTVTLANGQNWTQPYSFSIDYAGLWKVQFFLFKNGDFASSYRELHLYVRVG